ncbi:hypothetical protein EVAR_48077_1 [Eumeta japonica]|uniref:Uncharacterized protein n=1 Tax=Eumeta variegata TaxID=151549 RepID=A0A4C1X5S1_EUMVA|nr:hypothetical protein EVAR_48077_1 [Eumeta japonica]
MIPSPGAGARGRVLPAKCDHFAERSPTWILASVPMRVSPVHVKLFGIKRDVCQNLISVIKPMAPYFLLRKSGLSPRHTTFAQYKLGERFFGNALPACQNTLSICLAEWVQGNSLICYGGLSIRWQYDVGLRAIFVPWVYSRVTREYGWKSHKNNKNFEELSLLFKDLISSTQKLVCLCLFAVPWCTCLANSADRLCKSSYISKHTPAPPPLMLDAASKLNKFSRIRKKGVALGDKTYSVKMKVEKDFIKADSANLPKVDSFMIANFFASNPDFCSAEFRNVKTSVSSRQSYGDDDIGYVQLKRDHTLCTVKCAHKRPLAGVASAGGLVAPPVCCPHSKLSIRNGVCSDVCARSGRALADFEFRRVRRSSSRSERSAGYVAC